MALSRYVPGMKPGSTGRNVAVGLAYVVTFPVWVAFLWLTLPFMVWGNTDNMAEGLSFLPGVRPNGGPFSAAAAFVYVAVLYVLFLSLLPGPLLPAGAGGPPAVPNGTQPLPTATPTPTPTG